MGDILVTKQANPVGGLEQSGHSALRKFVIAALLITAGLGVVAAFAHDFITRALLWSEDSFLIALQAILATLVLGRATAGREPLDLDRRKVLFLALFVTLLAYAGHRWLLLGYDFVIDEQLADFDAFIYGHGRLAWPLPPEWQAESEALNTVFMLPVSAPVAWVSAYLPMNAVLRALVGSVTDIGLTAPLLTGLSLPLLWACARRIWPEDRDVAAVCVVLLACSAQFLMMGMTAFAMSSHLFFNLLWLWLFLLDRRRADLAALLVGFVATGLHQPLFHPMFVAPFVLLVLAHRRWARAAMFIAGYAFICGFWLYWPHVVHGLVAGPHSITASAGTDYWSRLVATLHKNRSNVTIMAANLARFVAWQHLLLLPLMLAAWGAIRREGLAAALALGIVIPILVMGLILPWQGFGFGYRYLHPVLGNAVLLAGFGWVHVRAEARAASIFRLASVGVLVVTMPLNAWIAYRSYAPYERLDRQINASGADYVIIDEKDAIASATLVINRPDLANRPIRLFAEQIHDFGALSSRICRTGAVVALPTNAFYAPIAVRFNVRVTAVPERRAALVRPVLERAGCRVVML